MGRFNHEHLPDKEQEDEDADDHNMTSAELSKVLLPEGAVTDILKSDEITSFIQNQFYDKAVSMLTESMTTALKKAGAQLTKKDFDDVLMATLNAANQAMFTANALSNNRIEIKLQESLNSKLDEQATAKSVNEWTVAEGAVATKLDEDYDKVYETVSGNNTKLVELNESKTVLDDKQNEAVENRNRERLKADVDDEVKAATFHEIDYQEYTDRKAQIEKTIKLIQSDSVTAVLRFIGRSSVPPKTIKGITFGPKVTGEPNAKLARDIYNAGMDFMLQTPSEYYIIMMIYHYCVEKYRNDDTIITPPSTSDHLKGNYLLMAPHLLTVLIEQSAMLCKSLEGNAAPLLRKYGRGRRQFNHESGLRVTMCPDRQDGITSLLCIYLSHAQRSMDYKMDIRDILENAAGRFTEGSITKTIAEMLPILEEAMQMKVSIQYDMTVRRLARVLLERSPVYQQIFDKYSIGASAEEVGKPLEILYTMMLDVALITRETQTHERLMAATSPESRKLKLRAQASYLAYWSVDGANAFVGQSATPCSIENCTEGIPTELLNSYMKRCPDKDPATMGFMCTNHFDMWRNGDNLTMKNGQPKKTFGERGKGKGGGKKHDKRDRGRGAAAKDTVLAAVKQAGLTSDDYKLLSALTADDNEPPAEELKYHAGTPGYKFNQDDYDTLTAADKKEQLSMLISKLESKPAQLSRAMEVFKKMAM